MEPNVHKRIHKCPTPVVILGQKNPVHESPSDFLIDPFQYYRPM